MLACKDFCPAFAPVGADSYSIYCSRSSFSRGLTPTIALPLSPSAYACYFLLWFKCLTNTCRKLGLLGRVFLAFDIST